MAYLNGNEIAKSNIGEPGIPAVFNAPAPTYDNKASSHQGGELDEFLIDALMNEVSYE